MKRLLFSIILSMCSWHACAVEFSLNLAPWELKKIAEKIWKNECGETLIGLTYWKSGENFASFGIGHFIWYPHNARDRFHETFPSLLAFFERAGTPLPSWIHEAKGCPWYTKEEFERHLHDPSMLELRMLLRDTIDLQALFIAGRLEKALPQMIEFLAPHKQEHVKANFEQLAASPQGLFALMDYVNFKGEGTASGENYNGEGWGLLHVLLAMPKFSPSPVHEFVEAASQILKRRIDNSPIERNERQWLPGWLERVHSYLQE